LCGEPEIKVAAKGIAGSPGGSKMEPDRMALLEKEVADLKKEVQRLWELTGLAKD